LSVPRSYLYVPGNRPERFDKALASGADAVILDLEDAVPPAEKIAARHAAVNWLSAEKPVIVRVNAETTEWFSDDLAICRLPGVAGIVLPKAENVGDAIIALCSNHGIALLPLIETAPGMSNATAIAALRGVRHLMFGTIDFQFDLGIDGDGDELLAFRSQLVLASRLAGIAAPIDGPCTSWDDVDLLSQDCARAKRLGFGGKLCIHPKQVAIVNAAFSPSDAEIAWAERVITAAKQSAGAAIAVDGRMIDRPIILKAERILASTASHEHLG
jgi:citrate lyase subunit beta / citryl-CoA lyase